MSNVQVAIRVRPLNARETADGARIALQVEDKIVRIKNMKLDGRPDAHGDSREKVMEFGFDYCYWSVDPEGPDHASQEEVFQDLGVSVLTGASEGYNVCLFAYGQTGSGKTYTMIGTPASIGLTPRICQGLFRADGSFPEGQSSCRVEISFLEIYNERVRDLLRHSKQKKPTTLRVREHPEKGPYVQGLSQYVVSDYKQAVDLLEMGIANRITAATHVHDASSRSHAIFSIQYTQAILENNLPSEIVSKINLVDLAGSERADPHYCRDRITEGSNINKSLVTLGIVISALAQNSQMFSSCQSINSTASEGECSVAGSQCSSYSGGGRRQCFIPYRDSILTWLLKDSLGGNSKTVMIATISPSCSSYSETLSTLRYAAHARNIVNKPRVNEDSSVKLIRELREEINRLKSMLLSFKMQRNPSPSLSEDRDGNLSDIVLQNELKVEQLTKDWTDHWHDKKELLEQYSVDINRDRAGFLIRSLLPHLIALDRDVLSTGVIFYHLREGVTKIGPQDQQEEPQIVLQGEAQCEIVNQHGVVTLRPFPGSVCMVNGREVTEPCQLAQGAVITLGEVHKFRFNHPAEAAILRERRRASEGALSCSMSDLSCLVPRPSEIEEERWEQGGGEKGAVPRQRVQEQQRYVRSLREEIQVEQQRAERDLEREQAYLRQQQRETPCQTAHVFAPGREQKRGGNKNVGCLGVPKPGLENTDIQHKEIVQQWALQEKQRLSANERNTEESEAQTDLVFKVLKGGVRDTVVGDRKRVVQEELLRHHALRRAENRVRRKRLHYQLGRIAQKRLLLEAKGELQCLECALSPEGSTSSEPGLPVKTKGSSNVLRRHSFSVDLLSRLYPKHSPLFSHIIRRNKRMRNRANTLPTGNRSLEGKTRSLESLKAGLLRPDQLNGGPNKRMPSFTDINVIKSGKEELQQTGSSELHGTDNKKASSTQLNTPYSPPKICKSSSKGSKSLERIRKVFSQSAGPGIRTALSKFFRKPPSGFVGNKGNQPTSTSQFQGNKGDVNLDAKTEQWPLSISLGQGGGHSEEALNKASVEQAGEKPPHEGSLDNRKGEEEEDSSDCDSSFSLDSLSSAYTKALAEQLRHEEFEGGNNSEPESVNSQISQDSLVMENSSKANTMRLNSKESLSSHCYSQVNEKKFLTEEINNEMFSSLEPRACDEMPAEAFWNLKGFHMAKAGNEKESKTELLSEPQSKAKSAALLLESKGAEEQEGGPQLLANSSSHLSWSGAKENENLCVLTDAWSSTEPPDSPSIYSGSIAISQSVEIHPVCSISLQNSTDITESVSGSETPTIHMNDSKDATLFQQEYWDSESENSQVVGMLEDHKTTSSIAAINSTIKESVYSGSGNLEECSEFVSGMKGVVEDSATLEKSGMQKNDDEKEHLSFKTSMCKPVVVAPLLCKSNCFPSEGEPRTFNSMETFPNDLSLDMECVGADKSVSRGSASGFLCNNTYSTSEDKFLNVKNAGAEEQQMDGIDSAVGSQSVIMSACDTDRSGCHEITVPSNLPLSTKLYSDPFPKRIIDFNEASVVNTLGLPFSKVLEDTLLNESELKGPSRYNCQAMGNTTEDIKVKKATILKTQDSDTMLNESQGTSQTLLSTETIFESKNLKVQSMNPKETLNFPVSSGCYWNEGKCTGSIAEGLSADRSCSESDHQIYLKGKQWAVVCDETKDYSVKTTSKGYKLGVITKCLNQGISQKVYSLKVHKTLQTGYRCKDFKRRKLKLGFCYTTTKYRRKKKAQNKACVYQEKIGKQKSFQKTQSNHLPFSEFFEVSTPTHQSPTNLVDIKKANISVMYSGLKNCKKCISAESVDVSVGKDEEPAHNRETVTVKQTADIQERIKELLEYSGRGNTEESDPSPVDQKISEVVKEHMEVTLKEFEESSNSDELVYEATTAEMEMDQKKSLLLEQMSLKDMDKSFFAVNIATSPSKSISLTSTNCSKTEATSVMSDTSQKNALTQIQHCSPDREVDRPGTNSGASVHNIMKHRCTVMVVTDGRQTVSESNKTSSSSELSNPANDPVIDVFRNQQVEKHHEANHVQEEVTLECCTAECQSISRHKIDLVRTGLCLDSVNQAGSKQNVEKHNIHSSTCLFENCHENDLSRQVHFSKPAIQTEGDNLRNTYASTVGSPITQLKDDQRSTSFHHAEHTSKSCLKRSQSRLNGPGTEDCDVLPKSHKQAQQSHTNMDIHIKPLLPSAKMSNAKMNLHENVSSIDSQNLDRQITKNCRLNFLEEQLCSEDSPQKVSSKYLCSADSQSKVGSEVILSKEISDEGNTKFHKRSCKLVDFTKAFKQEQIQECLAESKESGEGSFQRLYLKSEDSKEETYKVGTNSPTPALQATQEDTIHQTKEFEFHLNFLQSYPSPPNRCTQLTSVYTGSDCCMEVNNESKPLSSFATCTLSQDYYQQDSDIFDMPKDADSSLDDINPSGKTSTSSSDLKDSWKQLQDNKTCQAKPRQKGKLKKLSRLNARAATTSSSDSSANFSSEEVADRPARHKTMPDNQIQCKQDVSVKNKNTCKDHSKDWTAHSSSPSLSFLQNDGSKKELGETLNHKSSTLCTETKDISKRRDGEKGFQEEDTEKKKLAEVSKSDCIQKNVFRYTQKTPKHYSSLLAPKAMVQDLQNFKKMDTTIHFTSSDVNPFIHSWQDTATQRQRKVFGSAADISNKTAELDGAGNRSGRCCSVDNGLNVQSCPFYSHLSTFANNKTLSSTLSSIEGCKEQGSSECQYASNPLLKVHMGSYDSYCSDISRNLGNSSGQVDEIMLVCPSEQESSGAVHKEYSVLTCNRCTQTTVPHKKHKNINHQRRSRTETQRSSMGAEDTDVDMASTLANLQNMSLHLSQLIYNTSDLLGNMEAMDTTHVTVNNKTSSSSKCSKRDCSTQTAVDVAIQTDSIIKPVCSKNMQKEQQTKEKAQEVNVTVRVVGVETLSISPEKEDIALPLQGRTFKKNTAQEMPTLPNLSGCSEGSQTAMEIGLPEVKASTSSLKDEVVFQSFSHLKSLASPIFSSDHVPRQSFGTSIGGTKMRGSLLQKTQTPRKDNAFHHVAKGVYVTDRASSPILTVEAGVTQMLKSKSSQSLGNGQMTGLQEPTKELVLEHMNSLSSTAYKLQKLKEQCFSYKQAKILGERSQYGDQPIESSGNRYISSVSLENVRSLNYTPLNKKILQNDSCDRIKDQLVNVRSGVPKPLSMQSAAQGPRSSHLSKIHQASSAIPTYRNDPLFDCKLEESDNRQQIYILDKELSFDNYTLENHQKEVHYTGNALRKPEPFVREETVQLQEDDAVSLMASECNTDILINTRPLVGETEKEYLRIPEDLPLHNKFTNWSGVNCWPPSSPSSSLRQLSQVTSRQEMKGSHSDLGCSESPKTETAMLTDSRLREIERLRQEREQVMATVRLDMNHRQLTVELTEAKLHYGLGETDALLKLMKSGSIEEACDVPTKQQLYDRHRRSIEGLRHEREARLQSCRRPRSLSPSKPTPGRRSELPAGATELPSQQRQHLQKLRQAVVTDTSLTVPLRQTGECPSEIELLLKDYGRAREVAKSEIARARDRLRERTQQEKRRLHQQALSQLVKDDLRFRTRVSSSTLCTGSSLSLSSGPTSGYNSSNTARVKEGSRPSCPLQICEPSEDGRVKFRGCPPKSASLDVDPHRSWASAEDVRVEATVNKSDPQLLSTSHPRGHHRSLSFNSMPSIPPAYQDIAAGALSSAIAEIYSAGNGDLMNLLAGKASSGWRYQGAERGVHAFYKPCSSPSVHSFLGAAELQRPLPSLWCMIRDLSKAHLYHGSVHSTWTRPLDSSTKLVYLLTDVSSCRLVQPLDFCCISKESKQDGEWVLAVRSLCEKSLLPSSAEAVRGELFPSAWLLQPSQQEGREVVRMFYLLQVDLKTAALSPRLLSSVAKKQAAVISELDDFFSL